MTRRVVKLCKKSSLTDTHGFLGKSVEVREGGLLKLESLVILHFYTVQYLHFEKAVALITRNHEPNGIEVIGTYVTH